MIILIVTGAILLIAIVFFNSLIRKKNQVSNAFSSIDVMLRKRFDLIPNLVELVKQYMEHESSVLTGLTSLRTGYRSEMSNDEKMALDAGLSQGIRSVMLSAENYPSLKADSSFINLQSAWTDSEEQIAAARRSFNASVTDYNNAIMTFPGSIFAGMMSYQPYSVISIPDAERSNISARELFTGSNG